MMNGKEAAARRSYTWVWLLLFVLGALQVAYAAREYRAKVVAERTEILEEGFQKLSLILKERLVRFQYGLQGLSGVYFMEKMRPNPEQLRLYAESRDLYESFRGVLGFGFVRRVPNAELSAYAARRRQLDPSFHLQKLPGGFAPEEDFSLVVESIEPREQNEGVRGIIVSGEANRWAALAHARDTGRSTLTKLIRLKQVGPDAFGLLLFHPIYNSLRVPGTVEERRRTLVGYTYAPILIRTLLDSAAALEKKQLAIRMLALDGARPTEFYRSAAWVDRAGGVSFRDEINAFERPWALEGESLLEFWSAGESFLLYGTALLAILLYGAALYWAWRLKHFWSRAGQQVRSLETWQSAIFDGADFAIITTDPAGSITSVNRCAAEMLGYAPEELVGAQSLSLFHEKTSGFKEYAHARPHEPVASWNDIEALLAAARPGEVMRSSWIYVRKDGSRFPGQLSLKAIADEQGAPMGYLAIVEDVTEKKESEAKLVQSAQLASLGEMAGGVAHEINNPLAMIKLKAELMLDQVNEGSVEPARQRADLVKISEVVDRIAAIVAGLRSFSRDSAREALRETSLGAVLEDTLSLCRERFRASGIQLKVGPDPKLAIPCRPLQVSQALLNLLNNSFDAVATLTDPWVEVSVSADEKAVRLAVTDAGTGISDDVAARMMRPFFTTKEVGKGTGLGLSISKGLVEAQGGRLYYRLAGGHTQFVIELPLVPAKAYAPG